MKKFALVIAIIAALFVGSSAQAAGCGQSFKFYSYQYTTYPNATLWIVTTNGNYLISQIQANPQKSGWVKAHDLVCDGYTFYNFANGTYWPAR